MKLHELTAGEAAERIRGGELRAVELAQALVERHDVWEKRLNAMAWFDAERLLEQARRVDRRRDALEPLGPLAGVPVGVKDIFDCAGMPTSCGISGGPPRQAATSAECVRRLEAAGALVFGKTVTTERAFLDPGPTRNPWDLEHTPGGSSSGSAAGTAAGYFPLALGSQTAGSVIRPAAFCGVIGMTLTHGRVPLDGVLPLASSFDTVGFFARSIDDAELALAALCGADGHGPLPDELPLASLQRPVFLGFARHGFVDSMDDAAAHHALQTARTLLQKGAIVHVLKMPESFERLEEHRVRIFAREAFNVHRAEFERDPEAFGPRIGGLIEAGSKVSSEEYTSALEFLDRFRKDIHARLSEVDAIVLPATTGGAPMGLDSTGDPRCNAPWTAIGLPAVTIPSGTSDEGMPLGLQIVGKPMGERFLLRMARLCTEAIGYGCPVPA